MDKMITVVKLPADGSLTAITEEIPDNLTQLQHYVEGYIEIVTLARSPAAVGLRLIMIVNDCGLIWGLPVNPIATEVYHQFTYAETHICGNAIVCTADMEGELQNITPYMAFGLLRMAENMQKEGERSNDQRGS